MSARLYPGPGQALGQQQHENHHGNERSDGSFKNATANGRRKMASTSKMRDDGVEIDEA
jgi:hypothetical protein